MPYFNEKTCPLQYNTDYAINPGIFRKNAGDEEWVWFWKK